MLNPPQFIQPFHRLEALARQKLTTPKILFDQQRFVLFIVGNFADDDGYVCNAQLYARPDALVATDDDAMLVDDDRLNDAVVADRALSMIRVTNIGWRRMGGWRITPRLLWSLNEQQLSTFPGPHPQPFLKTNIHKPRIC